MFIILILRFSIDKMQKSASIFFAHFQEVAA